MNITLSNKHALICGATQGIGFAIAERFAECGADITLVARNEDSLKQRVDELTTSYPSQKFKSIVLDLSNSRNVADAINEITDVGKTISILVNNSGGPAPGRISSAEPDQFQVAFAQHVISAQILASSLLPAMQSSGFGRIINVISTSVKQPLDGLGVSNTIRGAMANWSKTLASEVAGMGVTVNNILPGATNTQRLQLIVSRRAKERGVPEEDIRREIIDEIPAKRLAEPIEIANVAAFLASDLASYITGTNVVVDGGRTRSL